MILSRANNKRIARLSFIRIRRPIAARGKKTLTLEDSVCPRDKDFSAW